MALGELATYVQERLPIALLVVSDGGYGMLRYDQDVAGDPHRGVDLLEPRWEDLAAAYGMQVARTDDAGAGLPRRWPPAREGLARGEQHLVVLDAALMPAAHHLAALARGVRHRHAQSPVSPIGGTDDAQTPRSA